MGPINTCPVVGDMLKAERRRFYGLCYFFCADCILSWILPTVSSLSPGAPSCHTCLSGWGECVSHLASLCRLCPLPPVASTFRLESNDAELLQSWCCVSISLWCCCCMHLCCISQDCSCWDLIVSLHSNYCRYSWGQARNCLESLMSK